jgi:cyclophilin family peptidyl-prolyl cis-trans isomerase
MVLILIILVVVVASAYYFVISGETGEDNTDNQVGNPIAVINTSMGIIKVELYEDEMPITCENFIKLANDGFYDGLIFHRILDGFMIQGGGVTPDFQKKQSPYGPIPLEIYPNLSHLDGAISMARQADPNIDSATSEFFICDGDQGYRLDDAELAQYGLRGYAVFGKTTEGLDVVHSISALELDPDKINEDGSGPPLEDVVINNITIQ